MSAQLPLALRFPADQTLEAFVGPPALLAAMSSLASGASADWLYLSGPEGCGKSHLMLGACAAAQRLGRQARYLPLAAVAGRVGAALDGLEGVELLCLDGLDAIAGHPDDEVALFHAHNRARANATVVVYAARSNPAGLAIGLPDLRSRLGQCTRLTLEPLDDEGRRAVLRQRAERRGLSLDEAVLDYLFRRVGRDLGSLSLLLDRLDRESLAAQRRITVPFLRQLLGASDT